MVAVYNILIIYTFSIFEVYIFLWREVKSDARHVLLAEGEMEYMIEYVSKSNYLSFRNGNFTKSYLSRDGLDCDVENRAFVLSKFILLGNALKANAYSEFWVITWIGRGLCCFKLPCLPDNLLLTNRF